MESDVECVYRDQKLLIDVCALSLPGVGGLFGLGFHALREVKSSYRLLRNSGSNRLNVAYCGIL